MNKNLQGRQLHPPSNSIYQSSTLPIQASLALVSHIPYRDITARAMEYLREHPELLDQAMEVVHTHPWYRAMAERQERERERQARKSRVLERSV